MRYLLSCSAVAIFICISCRKPVNSDNNIQKTEICVADPSLTYEIYIPVTANRCNNYPILLIIDPQGDAVAAIEKFKKTANNFPCLVAVSEKIKNNTPGFVRIISLLLDDIQEKHPTCKTIFLAGFSGGGRMALNYARNFPVSGVITCGALAPQEQILSVKARVICITGMADFNFIEAAQFVFNPEQAPPNLNLVFTKDSHTWPSADILTNAFGTLLLNPDDTRVCPSLKKAIDDFAQSQIAHFDSLYRAADLMEAGLLARNLTKSGIPSFAERLELIEYSSGFNNELSQLRESIRFELTVRNAYYEAFFEEGREWWENEITSLNRNIIDDQDMYRNYALQRIKGYLGIMCYSLCDNSLHQNDLLKAEKFLAIYRMIEPQNADMLYFTALFEYKSENPDRAKELLLKAVQAGFSDKEAMQKDFPEEFIQSF